MQVSKLTARIGVEVTGLDLKAGLSDAQRRQLNEIWLENVVLIVRDQADLTVAGHVDFSRCFGPIDDDSPVTAFSHPQHREVFLLTNETQDGKPSETRDVGWQWHADLMYSLQPSAGAVLHAQEVPETGGDTMFANMAAAYDGLSPVYRAFVDGLEAINDLAHGKWYKKRMEAAPQNFVSRAKPVVRALVATHPETGRRSLQLNEAGLCGIMGMTEEESAPILRFLNEHATQAEFVYRHRWRKGDLLVWDNRCSMHKVVADHNAMVDPGAPSQVRRMHRTTIKGLPSGRLLADAAE
jgi:taurine dioxygenase